MSIATRIENMSDNLKNAYDSLENVGIDLENVDKNLENLSSQIESLYDELPQISDNGTEISLSPTKKGKLVLKLNGNTEQKQYTGKNYLNTYAQVSTSAFGIDISVDEDGIITLNGTSTKDNNGINLNQTITGDGNTYTLKAEIISGTYTKPSSELRFNFHILSSEHSYNGPSQQFGESNSVTTTLTNGYVYDTIGFRVDNGIVLNNVKFKVQLEKSSTASEYEPYVGKQPSPNIDYPQKIDIVSGNNIVKCVGENLFDSSFSERTQYDITYSYENGIITFNGTSSGRGVVWFKNNLSNLINSGNNTIIFKYISGTQGGGAIRFSFGNENVEVTTDNENRYFSFVSPKDNIEDVVQVKNFDTNKEIIKWGVYINDNVVFNNYKFRIYVVQGSYTTGTIPEFKPYEVYENNINLWDINLFDSSSQPYIEGKYIDKNGNLNDNNEFSVYKTEVKPNIVYNFINSGWSTAPGVAAFDENDNYLGGFQYNQTANLTYKTPSKTKYILYSVVTLGTSSRYDANIYKLQEEIELCKIGNYQDYLYKENNKWYKHKTINKVILTENGNYTASSEKIYTPDIKDYLEENNIPISDYFIGVSNKDSIGQMTINNTIAFNKNATVSRFYIYNTNFNTSQKIKTWLASHNMTVYYILSSAVNIEITNPDLITQLNTLSKVKSFDNQTNVMQKNAGLPFIIEATALEKSV